MSLSLALAFAAQVLWEDVTRDALPVTAEWTNRVALADIDGDGRVDLLFANGGDYSEPGEPEPSRVFLNRTEKGKLRFEERTEAVFGPGGDIARVIQARDVSSDGIVDLFVGTTYQSQSRLYLGEGRGRFREVTATHLPKRLASVGDLEIGDVDGDFDLDVVLVDWGLGNNMTNAGGRTLLWVNDGTGKFKDQTSSRMPDRLIRFSWDLELADVDNDLDLDVLVSCKRCGGGSLYRNDGAGRFEEDPRGLPQYTNNYELEPMDVNGDGFLDLVTVNDGEIVDRKPFHRREHLFLNDGQGRYLDATPELWPDSENIGEDDNMVAFLDADSDGDPDFVMGSLSGPDRLLVNDGRGRFTVKTDVFGGEPTPGTLAIALADLDSDHRLDIVQAQGEHETAVQERVFLGRGLPIDTTAPSISLVSESKDRLLVRARVHDFKTPNRPEDWTEVVLEAGERRIPMTWYGENLFFARVTEPIASYRVCASDRAGNDACAGPATSSTVDFEREVKPILAASCVGCHGPERTEADLRLDTREGLLAGGASGAVVVSGDGRGSVLYKRLIDPDPAKRMPWYEEPLPPEPIETLRRWIDAGAPWPSSSSLATASIRQALPAVGTVRFNRDVRPILANCYSCHGPDRNQRQAGLRLDREEVAKAPLPSGNVAIVPGAPEKSELLERVTHSEESLRMPAASSGKPRLTANEIATLRLWIQEGASWEPHWSYIPPVRPKAPPEGAVDAFLLAEIQKQGLTFSPEAKRSELLRRLSFDLTGLPPTADEVRAFESDTSADGYEKEVDRLLSSPRYGERMAAFWLDLVRYSDSVGYHSDNERPLWRYRDWVVDAFNRNLPFDRFTVEQLAGDLLPEATFDQKIASGYNRLLQTTEEGGGQPKEYRAIYLADRARNASTVWLGATLGCAQCHDHKFDPYLAKDFYSFEAFFADIVEEPVGRRKPTALPAESEREVFEAAEAEVERLENELEEKTPDEAWEEKLLAMPVCWTTLEPVEATTKNGTRLLIQGNDFSLIATTKRGPKPPLETYTVRFETALQDVRAFRLEAVPFEELPKGGPGRDPDGGFVLSDLEILDPAGQPIALAMDSLIPWTVDAADGETHRLILESPSPVGTEEETALTLVLHQNAGSGRTIGRFRMSATVSQDAVCREPGPGVSRDLHAIAATPRSERTLLQREEIEDYYRSTAPELQSLRSQLREAQLRRDSLLEHIPQSYVTTTVDPEPVRILPRGNWLDESGAVVEPAVPHFLPSLETDGRRATRLDLAQWLTSSSNPLTARVLANRLWKLFFGQGLSRTLEDLGTQGEWPTHPELLDWLAVELVERGWDVKHLVRTIVTSRAYRQTSRSTPELLDRDPYNRLYARQSRFRLDAEMVRDNALAVSGLLSLKIGGPSVYPYQPPGYWTFLNFPPREWDDSEGEDQHRRGLYTWWQRSFLHPSLLAFDAPTREECLAERTRSNIPQQALVLLNDPTYVEAARAFADSIMGQGGKSFEERVEWAYWRALDRAPREEEVVILSALHEKHGWTSVARTILNLPEVITRP